MVLKDPSPIETLLPPPEEQVGVEPVRQDVSRRKFCTLAISAAATLVFRNSRSSQAVQQNTPEQSLKQLNYLSEETKAGVRELEKPEAIKLIIERRELGFRRTSNNVVMLGRSFNLGAPGTNEISNYYNKENPHPLSLNSAERVQILIETNSGLQEVILPQDINVKLAEYFKFEESLTKGYFDCASFAHFINDIEYDHTNYQPANWSMQPLNSEDLLKPGDTIAMARKGEEGHFTIGILTHFAIYLGEGLYISKGGNSGRLIVTNLTEMKKAFEGSYVYRAVPKIKTH